MTTTLDDKQTSREFFNKYVGAKGPVGAFSRFISNTGYWYADMVIKEAKLSEDDLVLDIGCGSATTIVNLLKRFYLTNPIQGIEPSDAQFALAQKNVIESRLSDMAQLQQGFAAPLPFEDNRFDVAYASFIYKHFADESLKESLKEAYRVLKPGGKFLAWEFRQVTNPIFKKMASDPSKAMQNFRTFSEFESLAKEVGFNDIQEMNVHRRGFWDPAKHVGFKAIK